MSEAASMSAGADLELAVHHWIDGIAAKIAHETKGYEYDATSDCVAVYLNASGSMLEAHRGTVRLHEPTLPNPFAFAESLQRQYGDSLPKEILDAILRAMPMHPEQAACRQCHTRLPRQLIRVTGSCVRCVPAPAAAISPIDEPFRQRLDAVLRAGTATDPTIWKAILGPAEAHLDAGPPPREPAPSRRRSVPNSRLRDPIAPPSEAAPVVASKGRKRRAPRGSLRPPGNECQFPKCSRPTTLNPSTGQQYWHCDACRRKVQSNRKSMLETASVAAIERKKRRVTGLASIASADPISEDEEDYDPRSDAESS